MKKSRQLNIFILEYLVSDSTISLQGNLFTLLMIRIFWIFSIFDAIYTFKQNFTNY